MLPPTIGKGLVQEALTILRTCGVGRTECVCFLTGPLLQGAVLDEVVHPRHRAGRGFYEVDNPWFHTFSLELRARHRTVRAQIHSHPGRAFHSATDDRYAVVNTPGFVSIVVPRFATEPYELDDLWVGELQPDGSWRPLRPEVLIA